MAWGALCAALDEPGLDVPVVPAQRGRAQPVYTVDAPHRGAVHRDRRQRRLHVGQGADVPRVLPLQK